MVWNRKGKVWASGALSDGPTIAAFYLSCVQILIWPNRRREKTCPPLRQCPFLVLQKEKSSRMECHLFFVEELIYPIHELECYINHHTPDVTI